MTAEEILELVRAGYTKEEILAMDQKEAPEHEAPEHEAPEQEAKDEKKTSSPDSEAKDQEEKSKEDSQALKALKDKLDALEQKFFSKNREQASIPSDPEEDLSMKAIFTSLNTEEETKNG